MSPNFSKEPKFRMSILFWRVTQSIYCNVLKNYVYVFFLSVSRVTAYSDFRLERSKYSRMIVITISGGHCIVATVIMIFRDTERRKWKAERKTNNIKCESSELHDASVHNAGITCANRQYIILNPRAPLLSGRSDGGRGLSTFLAMFGKNKLARPSRDTSYT